MEPSVTYNPDQLSTPAVIADPYPLYHRLREHWPFLYTILPAGFVPGLSGPLRGWAFMQYAHVYTALRDHATFSSARNPLDGVLFPKLVLLTDDPPRHARFRRLVNAVLTLKRIEALIPWITSVVTNLLDTMETDAIDLVQAYTIPLPVRVIAPILGIPPEKYVLFKQWSEAAVATISMEPEQRSQYIQAMVEYFGKLIAARRAHGAEDLISALIQADVEGERLQEWEVLGFCLLLLIAGNETTTHLIGNLFNLLAERPLLWRQLREDRGLVDVVIEETLRYETPVQRLFRVTTREVKLSGVTVPEGALIAVFFGSANRDPTIFPDPDVFRLDRDLRQHVAFGTGVHYCLGAPLARAEARITLNAFLDRFSTLVQGKMPRVRQTATDMMLGFHQLPLVLDRKGK